MKNIQIIILLLFTTVLYANPLDINILTSKYDLLPDTSIYIDNTNKLTFEEVQKNNIAFEQNDQKLLGYGYSPDFTVWLKFTLKNTTNQPINKLLEYDSTLTTDIVFYDGDKKQKEGLLNITNNRQFLTPTFDISLKPYETKVYYIKASSHIATLIIKLILWDKEQFYADEIHHQFILALFFGAMFILAIYNLFVYFFTKDISYMYYVVYILGVSLHHSLYTGVSTVYVLDKSAILFFLEMAPLVITFPIYALALFTKSFLSIEKQPIHNKILSFFLIIIPLSLVVILDNDTFLKYRNILPLLLTIYLIYLTIYNVIKRNRQAYFILFGWMIIFIAIIAMNLSSSGIFDLYKYFNYIIELAFILEGVVFAIALSDKINNLQAERNRAQIKLLEQQKNEKKRLEIKVDEKTNDLKIALEEKALLLKELNHRVKNNMQTIVSLIRLQSDEIEDEKYIDILRTIQNRINAMSHVHEMLYQSECKSHINTNEYFGMLIEELEDSFDNEIEVIFDISLDLKIEQAIYCGIIFNELITNSFKYAFPKKNGHINVKLYNQDDKINFIVSDNGIGYDSSKKTNSLGLVLIDTLVTKQLQGEIRIESNDGVKVEISWDACS
ncbi:MAG: 7TM diverse intracellular signaling domain-containing protein [Arcobacteraceae bacterium]